MRDFAKRPENDRRDLFRATAEAMSVNEAIIEKDFWVCWVLDYLFLESPWKDKLIFKGGTSLSKAYGAIQRFSEDVDLVIDWSLLGLTEKDAFQERSNKKQDDFGKEASEKTVQFLESDFNPVIQQGLSDRLDTTVAISQDQQVVTIEYPRSFSIGYIRPEIILEIGPKALHEPNEQKDIFPYAAEKYPEHFTKPGTVVCTVSVERTFWEKATILHQEAHRSVEKTLPQRYSRHYYDLYRLCQTPILEKAL